MNVDCSNDKKALREAMLAARDALAPEARLAAAQALVRVADTALRPHLPAPGGVIAGYWPIRSEIDPRPLMQHLKAQGYRLALPRMVGETLVFHAFEDESALVSGAYGTREPSVDAPVLVPDLILTPLVAFDAARQRLGYGKGFYDRAFVAFPNAKRIGLAYAMQQVAQVPSEAHDAPLDGILTEKGARQSPDS